ncbi:unknown protein [Microcystis aeruginosa NIES-843]|uniref:Uncharacterized protein n=1 Tax=Microcystis aeruginosa (strain NIES-843 / IAM M-2473) TaxID=449447 RepID=B0JUZ8_MICAN|nr:unknown protein [Microcystis aeruginosa NIES-843]
MINIDFNRYNRRLRPFVSHQLFSPFSPPPHSPITPSPPLPHSPITPSPQFIIHN